MALAAMLYIAIGIVLAGTASAQSLADVARQEAERRKSIQSSGKVYTNDNLRDVPPPSPAVGAQPPVTAATPDAPPAASSPATTPPAGKTPAAAGTAPPTSPADTPPQGEAEWRKRIAAARDALSRSQIFAEALQSRINALTADFVSRDDPAQREVVASERQKSLAELDRVKQDIQEQQKAITAIQEDARRAGVPPGWVR